MKKLTKILIGAILVVVLLYSCTKKIINDKAINVVRNSEFDEGVTIGKVVNKICSDNKWECKTTETGQVYVIYSGKLNKKDLKMHFMIRGFAGETHYILNVWEFDGQRATRADYGDLDEMLLALYKLYLEKQ